MLTALLKPENSLDVLRQRPTDVETKAWAVSYMKESTASFQYTESVLQTLMQQAKEEIARLGGNDALSRILEKLA